MLRKDFLRLGTVLASSVPAYSFMQDTQKTVEKKDSNKAVDFLHDGLHLSPSEYAAILMQMADEGRIKPDYYSNNGIVEDLEQKFATLLGKESAVWMPTGTLANHIALRRLAGDQRRVIVQEQSHVYNDTGDAAQSLSNLNLIPLGYNAVSYAFREVEEVITKTQRGRVETNIGAFLIETPVRRLLDRMIPFSELKTLTELIRLRHYKIHLDGARIFVQAAHEKRSPTEYCAMFDTVYTSLWKCFNSASGAILAGTKSFTEKLFHERRMFGGGLPAAWPFAAVALHYADSFLPDYIKAWETAENLITTLERHGGFEIKRFENGSHMVRLHVNVRNQKKFQEELLKMQIEIPIPDEGFLIKINPSLNRRSPSELADAFIKSFEVSSTG